MTDILKRLAKSKTRYFGMSPRGEIAGPHAPLIATPGNCSGLPITKRDEGPLDEAMLWLNVTPELLREFLAHLSKPNDETVTLYADGRAVERPVV